VRIEFTERIDLGADFRGDSPTVEIPFALGGGQISDVVT